MRPVFLPTLLVYIGILCPIRAAKSIHEGEQQSILIDEKLTAQAPKSLLVQVQSEVLLQPELARLQVIFSATESDTISAAAKAQEAREAVNKIILDRYSDVGTSEITARGRWPVSVEKTEEASQESERMEEQPQTQKFRATASYTIIIQPLDDLEIFVNNLTIIDNLFLTRVDWEVLEPTKQTARRELRRQTLSKAYDAAKDYADAFQSMSSPMTSTEVTLVKLEEQWISSEPGEQHRWYAHDEDRTSAVTIPTLTMELGAAGEFVLN